MSNNTGDPITCQTHRLWIYFVFSKYLNLRTKSNSLTCQTNQSKCINQAKSVMIRLSVSVKHQIIRIIHAPTTTTTAAKEKQSIFVFQGSTLAILHSWRTSRNHVPLSCYYATWA